MTFGKKSKAAAEAATEKTAETAVPETQVPEMPPAASADAAIEPIVEVEPPPPSETDVLKDRLLRLQADFDNYRKRMARERQETILRSNEDLLAALLTPIDHMDRALATLRGAGEDNACLSGVRLVRAELQAVMDRFGLKGIETSGKPFDPAIHEALGWASVPNVPEGHVAAEVRAGYLLNGRVLRAAQVMLAGAPSAAQNAPTAPAERTDAEG